MSSNFKLSDKTKRKLEKQAVERAKELAIEARELLTEEYLYVVKNFYSEYSPKYYLRHFNNHYDLNGLLSSGMGKTFGKYYKNSHGTHFHGGICISTENMYKDYQDQESALNSFLNGYHGHPALGIYSSINTYEHMLKYRDFLIADFQDKATIGK